MPSAESLLNIESARALSSSEFAMLGRAQTIVQTFENPAKEHFEVFTVDSDDAQVALAGQVHYITYI